MIVIDGSAGEGGGQLLRSALSLAMVTGCPFTIKNIRAKRKNPGLMRQHLTAVHAAARVSAAEVQGDITGSSELVFHPRAIRPGHYEFSVGTAGSATLVFQTVLPALMTAGGESVLILSGGTHNPLAPPFPFLEKTFLPVVRRMGPRFDIALKKYGFYPAGGGEFSCTIYPTEKLESLRLMERGEFKRHHAYALVSNLPKHIAERELTVVQRKLNWPRESLTALEIKSHGPGNMVFIEAEFEHITEVFSDVGEVHKPAEEVAATVVHQYRKYIKSSAPAGEFLTDQLLLPLALAGSGEFKSIGLSLHARTQMDLIEMFMGVKFSVEKLEDGVVVRL